MSSFWRFLSGEIPGGFAIYLVAMIAFLLVLEYVYRIGQTLKRDFYRRWRLRGPLLLLVIYLLWWIQAPPKRPPLRIAVVCAERTSDSHWASEGLADLTARRLRRSLQKTLINPWEGAANYLAPADSVLEKAGYRVYRVGCDPPQAGRAFHYSLANDQGAEQSFSATDNALLELSAHFCEWIMADLGSKRALASAFRKEPAVEVLNAYYRGRAHLMAGSADSAQANLSAALSADSNFVPARILLARSFEIRGQRQQAYEALLDAVQADSDAQESLLALGEFYLRGYEWEEAEAALKVVLGQNPLQARAASGLANIHPERLKDLRLNRPEKLLQEALRLDPAFESARVMLADVLAQKSFSEEARKVLQEGLRINPRSQDLLLKLGAVELHLGRAEAARSAYEAILQQYPLNTLALFNLGVVDYRAKQYDRAIQRFEEVQGLNGPVDCYYYLGLIYMIRGDKSRAKFFFQRRWDLRSGENDAFGLKARDMVAELDGKVGG